MSKAELAASTTLRSPAARHAKNESGIDTGAEADG